MTTANSLKAWMVSLANSIKYLRKKLTILHPKSYMNGNVHIKRIFFLTVISHQGKVV